MKNNSSVPTRTSAALIVVLLALFLETQVSAQITDLASFNNGPNGDTPYVGVVITNGMFYGATVIGGSSNDGIIYSLPIGGGVPNVLASFNGVDGFEPQSDLILTNGTLYGATFKGGSSNDGAIYSVPIGGGTPTVLASFNKLDGLNPEGNLLLANGTLYGATYEGGSYGFGTVFSVPIGGGTPTVLASFNQTNGAGPDGNLVLINNTLYGTTASGGSANYGTFFSLPIGGGTPTVLTSFNTNNGGDIPIGGLIVNSNTFYGTTYYGSNGYGSVFSISTNGGAPTVLASFNGSNGINPEAQLLLTNGTLYGTTAEGGSSNSGTVFSVPIGGGSLTVLASFNGTNGGNPQSSLIMTNGTLYGTAGGGGSSNDGVVFSLALSSDLYIGSNNASQTTNFRSGTTNYGNAYVSYSDAGNTSAVTGNTLVVSNAGTLLKLSGNAYVGYNGNKGSNNGMIVAAGGVVVDGNGSIGTSNNNAYVIVTGSNSFWSNTAALTVGDSGSSNSLTISNGGTVEDVSGSIGMNSSASNNTVLVTGSNSLWSSGSTLTIGNKGTGVLTVSSGGNVTASNIIIASQAGSTGTLNIGSFGGNVSGGTLGTQSLVFGSGSGILNFNQGNAVTLSSSISGSGSVNQFGSGTSILSGSNSYTGKTTITNGTLTAVSATALGSSSVTLTGGVLSLSTNLSISSMNWNSGGVLALPNVGIGDFLTVTGLLSVAGTGTQVFNLSGYSLSLTPVELLSYGSGSPTVKEFSAVGVTNYTLIESNNDSLWIEKTPPDLYVGSNSTVSATNFTSGTNIYLNAYVGYTSKASNNLLKVGGAGTVLNNYGNLTVGVAGSGNSMVISNGGVVHDVNGTIGGSNNAIGNSVLVTGTNSLWSNDATLTVGNAGGGTLTVGAGGTVVALGGINIAAQNGSSGTLGIGSLPASSGSGTFLTPRITFGFGMSTIATTGTLAAGSNTILPSNTLSVEDPLQLWFTNSTAGFSEQLGGVTNAGNMTYIFNRSGSSIYEVALTNGRTLQPFGPSVWNNTSTNMHTNAGTTAVVFAPSDNFLYNESFLQTNATITVPTNGVQANQVTFIDSTEQNFQGGMITATSFSKSGSGVLNVGNMLQLIGSILNSGSGGLNLGGQLLSGAVNQGGTGTMTLSTSNSYQGGTILSGGTIAIGNSSSLGGASVYVEGNGTLSSGSTVNVTNAVSLLRTASLTLGAQSASNSLTESGAISGTGSLNVRGNGTVSLSGNNSYSGGTTVSLGTLAATSLGSGPLAVQATKGTSALFLDALGSGTLSLGSVTLGGNGSIGILNPYNSILSSGAVTITGTNNFINLSGAWTNLGTYSLLTGTKITGSGLKGLDLSGSFLGGADLALDKSTNYDGLIYTFTNTSTDFDLTISRITSGLMVRSDVRVIKAYNISEGVESGTAVPEPSTYALIGLGALMMAVARMRRFT